jgi:protein-S-isoprenylcysteine O-methyltransferase Ste14
MKKPRQNFALAIALTGILSMIAVGGYRLAAAAGTFKAPLTAVVILLYIAWILSEFRVTVGESGKETTDDKGTCEAYAIGRFITMLAAFGFDSLWPAPGLWFFFGFGLFAGGIIFRTYAIRTLGRLYSHRVRTPNQNTIIADGPYRFLRHPAYAGMLLAHVGILILFFNWFLLIAFSAIFIPVLVRRIRVEEHHLLAIPEYRAFAAGRARVAPGIW